jgi:AraC-like DNA-binding protein
MSYREILPHPALRAAVDRFWVRSGAGELSPQHILPDGCIDVLIGLDSRRAYVVGTMTRALVVTVAPVATAAVRFRPGGAAAFLGVTAHELTDRRVPASELLRWLTPDVLDAEEPLAAVALLEQCLLARLGCVAPPERAVAHVVRACFGPMPPPVAALARQLGWSRQRLTRVLREQVGIGAKELLRVARLQRAVDQLQRPESTSLASAAAGLGYFDQAHLCRDFRELVGVSPAVVRASARTIFPIRSLLAGA